MSDSGDENRLTNRSTFDRVVSSLDGWIRNRSLEFRFVRGGAFRASVVKEHLASTLASIDVDNSSFDTALSEVVVFLNAIVFDYSPVTLFRQLKAQIGRASFSEEHDDRFESEVNSRLSYVKANVQMDLLKSRAHMRQYATSLTFDSIKWSVFRGNLSDTDGRAVEVDMAGVILSLFRPGLAQSGSSPFSLNIMDLGIPQTEKVAMTLDENDIGEIITELEKTKRVLQSRGRK